jgi:hypothetical protein
MTDLVLTGWAVLALVLGAPWLRQLWTQDATSVFVPWPPKVNR